MALFRLIRLPNLIIVSLTQFLLYYQVIRPAIAEIEFPPRFDAVHFTLLVFVTVLITAIGYVINDILDYPVDQINRPEGLIVERKISFQASYWLIAVMSLTGFFIALYLSFFVRQLHLLFLYPAALAGLYLYSAFLKKQWLIGNLLIGLYCAGAGAVLWLAELPALKQVAREDPDLAFLTQTLFLWFAGFAFLATVFREIIKDMEDLKGDQKGGYRTLPIKMGVETARKTAFTAGLILLTFIGYYGWTYRDQFSNSAVLYILLAVAMPLLGTLSYLWKAQSSRQFHQISQLAKFIILTGILLLLFTKP